MGGCEVSGYSRHAPYSQRRRTRAQEDHPCHRTAAHWLSLRGPHQM